MFRNIAFLIVTIFVVAACGSSPAATSGQATQTPAIAQTATSAPTQAPATAAPTVAPTVAPTATPRPTPKLPVLVEVTSDQDVAENFVCKTPAEVAKLIDPMTYADFKFPLMFDPRGKKFTISVYDTKFQDGRVATLFVIKLTSDTEITVMTYLPTKMSGLLNVTYGTEKLFLISPVDESSAYQALGQTNYLNGGRGVYLEASASAVPLVPVRPNIVANEVGKPILTMKGDASPILTWPGNGHLVIRGADFNLKYNASPITKDSRLMEGSKQVAICKP